jgi:hypothetical protein
VESGLGELAHGGRQGDAGGAQGEARGRTRRRTQQETLAVLLDFGLGQGFQVGQDIGPGGDRRRLAVGGRRAEASDAVFQLLLQDEREKAAGDAALLILRDFMKEAAVWLERRGS